MKARDLMTQGAFTCRSEDNLATAAKQMWDGDCGIIPVVDQDSLCGLITDRDICMAVASKGCSAQSIKVAQVMNSEPHSCRPDSDLKNVLQLMRVHQVRRLPVTSEEGELVGLLSINDIILEAKAARNKTGAPTYKDVVTALQEVSCHRELPAVV